MTKRLKSLSLYENDELNLTVVAEGESLTYQWYYKKKGQSEFSVWNGRTNSTETVTPNSTWDGIQLYCRVTDGNGKKVDTNIMTVTYHIPISEFLKITVQPRSQYITLGKPLTISVEAEGSELCYQWYYRKKGQSEFSVWNGRTNATETVTPNATWDGIQLYCRVTDGNGNSVKSNVATVTVN